MNFLADFEDADAYPKSPCSSSFVQVTACA